MSGVAVVRYLLANAAGVTALVPATRIMAGTLPLNTALPALAVAQVSGVHRLTLGMVETGMLRTERVQVTVLAKTYASQKAVLAAVLAACPNQRGTVNGVALDSVLPDGEGPDLFDADATICEQSIDFIVKWRT